MDTNDAASIDLGRMLSIDSCGGVFWREHHQDADLRAMRAQTNRVYSLDLAECDTPSRFLERIGKTLHFPSFYGRNWDAMLDCLGEIRSAKADASPICLVLRNARTLATTRPDLFAAIAATLVGADLPSPQFVQLVVLFVGD